MSNIDAKELKSQALTQRVAELTAEYENKIADLRVALTIVSAELEELKADGAQDNDAGPSEF